MKLPYFARALVAAAASLVSIPPAAGATTPHVLSTEELRVLLQGGSMSEAAQTLGDGFSEQFGRDGNYLGLGDRMENPGRYTIRNNMVCTHTPLDKNHCRYILVDHQKRYWAIVDLGTRRYTEVRIHPPTN